MLHHFLILAFEPATHGNPGPGFGVSLGPLLSGIAAILVALGSGIGAYLRYRSAARTIRTQANDDAIKAIQDAAEHLSEQYEERIEQYKRTLDHLEHANDEQRHLYEERLANLQALNNTLLAQILNRRTK